MKLLNLKKKTVLLGGLCLALVATGVTFALLSTRSQENVNKFSGAYGQVNISVIENDAEKDLEDEVIGNTVEFTKITTEPVEKKVKIKNLDKEDYRTTDTYVRVRLIPQLIHNENSDQAYGGSVGLVYTLNTSPDTNGGVWKYDSSNDTFYYTRALAPNETTVDLLTSVKLADGETVPDGYHLELNVLADGIIANPIENLKNAWNLTAVNGDYFSNLVPIQASMNSEK